MIALLKTAKQGKLPWQRLRSILAAAVLALFAVVGAFEFRYRERVYPGVSVAGVKLAGQTLTQAEATLDEANRKANDTLPAVTLQWEKNQWHILKAEIDFAYLPQVTAQKAFAVGRGGILSQKLRERVRAVASGVNLPFDFTIETADFETKVNLIAETVTVPPIPPAIEVLERPLPDGSWTVIIPGEAGQEIDVLATIARIYHQLSWLETGDIALPVETTDVAVTEEAVASTKTRAERLLQKSLTIVADSQDFSLTGETLVNFLNFEGGFDQSKLSEYVHGLAQSINRPAQDAAFQYVGGKVTEFRPAQTGLTLDEDVARKMVLQGLEALEAGDAKTQQLTLDLERTEPNITLAEVNDLGIKELLGIGVSTYRGSIPGRVHNISLSSSRLNGALVAPGEEFSFNSTVGEISAATGYQQAYVIRSGQTVLDDGGGVCQTSTTLFRALLDAGLPITARSAHSYRVGYYEQNAKAGLDATVYAPRVDLKFVNDTPAHLLIQTIASSGSQTLTVEIYGTSDGRESQILNHRVWDVVPAPPDRYQDDPSLPPGTVKQVDFAAPGAKAKFDYVVTRNGEQIFSKTFYSNFRPWQAVFLRGV